MHAVATVAQIKSTTYYVLHLLGQYKNEWEFGPWVIFIKQNAENVPIMGVLCRTNAKPPKSASAALCNVTFTRF
jgi:hypothetical protein